VNGRPRPRRAPLRAGAAVGLLALASAACGTAPRGVLARSAQAAGRPAATGPAATVPAATGPARTGRFAVVDVPIRSWRRLPPSPPVRLEIPAIGVSAPLVRLGLGADGRMQAPGDFQAAGWFTGATQPGQLGPAVIAGHVDSRTGPAVFYRLHDLRPGDLVRVVRADRRVVRFVVESLARFPKPALPADRLYGPTTAPALRMITCTGTFDHRRRSYRDNLLVSAAIAAEPHAEAGR
jgi:Sortase domain